MELALLKQWDDIWQYYENQPETIEALQGIFYLLSHPDMKNIEFGVDFTAAASSPFNRLFGDPLSLKEVIRVTLDFVKNRFVGDQSIQTVIKGTTRQYDKPDATFDVELTDQMISKIGLKRKKLTSFKHGASLASSGAPVVFWTSNYSMGGKPDIYQTLRAAILDGAFTRDPFRIEIGSRHFRYPVYQHKQNFNIMLVLDISSSVKWILKFMEKIISMLTTQANASKDKLGLVTFNNDRAQILHYPTTNVRHVIGTINTLSPKGKTPLAEGVKMAMQTLEHSRFQVTGMSNAIVLLSDCFPEPITGEYREQLDEPACQELLHVCDKIAEAHIKMLILNPSMNTIAHYEKHIGYRLGTLAAERAKGSFMNLVAEVNQSLSSTQTDYVFSDQMLNKFMQEISEFRTGL